MRRSEIYSYHPVMHLSRRLCFTSSSISYTLQSAQLMLRLCSQLCERLKPRDPACLGAELRPQESEIRCRAMGRYARVIRRVGHRGLGNGQRGQVGLLFSKDGMAVYLPLCVRTRPCRNMDGVDIKLHAS